MADAKKKPDPRCARCDVPKGERYCLADKGRGPADCPSLHHRKLAEETFCRMPPAEMAFAREASIQEGEGWGRVGDSAAPCKPRIVELVEFSRRMGYAKLGLIFCGGFAREGAIVHEIMETNGFAVVSAMCKVGKIAKSAYGLTREQHTDARKEHETACNPLLQAELANQAGVDFNILLGLCVGHDSLVLQHLKAPATVLAVKDRLLGHNPMAAIYMYDSYYRYLKKPLP